MLSSPTNCKLLINKKKEIFKKCSFRQSKNVIIILILYTFNVCKRYLDSPKIPVRFSSRIFFEAWPVEGFTTISRHRFAIPLAQFVKKSIGSQNTTAWYRQDLAAYSGVRSPSSHFLVFLTFFFFVAAISSPSSSSSLLPLLFLPILLLIFPLFTPLFFLIFLAVPLRGSTDFKSHLRCNKLHKNYIKILQSPAL